VELTQGVKFPEIVGIEPVFTINKLFLENVCEQFDVALVVIRPVTLRIFPLSAGVKALVGKVAAPEPSAVVVVAVSVLPELMV
jgi:hypothetical protein